MKTLSTQKAQLGKGLAALMAGATTHHQAQSETQSNSTKELDINLIKANPDQHRKIFKESELLELAASIKENGVIQPLIVMEKDGEIHLIAGERRLRASKIAGLTKVPVVYKNVTQKDVQIMAIVENVQRENLNCIEEALAYYQLMSDFSLTQEEVSKKIGKERSTIANFLRLLKLPKDVLILLQKDLLSFGHGKVLAAVKEEEKILRLANEAVAQKWSVRELEKKTLGIAPVKAINPNQFFDQRMDLARQKIEKVTGFHFDVASNKKGKGKFIIKFNNEAEFNDICNYFLK